MELFAKATRNKLRFFLSSKTVNGVITVEELWGLELEQLNTLAVQYDEELRKSQVSFIDDVSPANELAQLRFDIVKYVIDTKKAEQLAQKTRAEQQAERQMYLDLRYKKQQEQLNALTIEELDAQLAKYD